MSHHWTDEERDMIRTMLKKGMRRRDIAKHFPEVSYKGVSGAIDRWGREYTKRKKLQEWTLFEERRLVELRDDGLMEREISEEMGRSCGSIRNKVHHLRSRGVVFRDNPDDI